MGVCGCVALLFLICTFVAPVESLSCFSCQNIDDSLTCNKTSTCTGTQVCFLDVKGGIYNMGCIEDRQCGGVGGPSIVGRDLAERQSSNCHECCSTDGCNSDLCKHQKLDGNWAQWSTWSGCDVTCDNGVQTRSRTCTNPAPANGGLDCPGNATGTKVCQRDVCPVHGGWGTWLAWSSCSVTCDVGMQRRDRTCTNPYPSLAGNHCFGSSMEDRICLPGACSDGKWSSWGNWGACSESCRGGVRSRLRTCINPRPSLLGRYCEGSREQVTSCNNIPCPAPKVAFTAYGATGSASFIFPHIIYNEGGGYNSSTGIFTCPHAGVYNFAATITKTNSVKVRFIRCYLKLNSSLKVGSVNESPNTDTAYLVTISGTFHLDKNDHVNVYCDVGFSAVGNNLLSSFTGFLVTTDY